MTAGTEPLTERPAWKALKAHYDRVRDLHLRKLLADDSRRGEQMTASAGKGAYSGWCIPAWCERRGRHRD
jgi:hypothetical protein